MVKQTLFQYVDKVNTVERICLKLEMEAEIPNKISDPYSNNLKAQSNLIII